jgi:hypothetical protein
LLNPDNIGHEKFRACLKVPVDRRGKTSNDMTVEVAPAVEELSPQHSLPECNARELRMLVSPDPQPAS